jgi:hypothetical protein
LSGKVGLVGVYVSKEIQVVLAHPRIARE